MATKINEMPGIVSRAEKLEYSTRTDGQTAATFNERALKFLTLKLENVWKRNVKMAKEMEESCRHKARILHFPTVHPLLALFLDIELGTVWRSRKKYTFILIYEELSTEQRETCNLNDAGE